MTDLFDTCAGGLKPTASNSAERIDIAIGIIIIERKSVTPLTVNTVCTSQGPTLLAISELVAKKEANNGGDRERIQDP